MDVSSYYCAQLLSQEGYPAVVMGTGNMDEDGYLAYFCNWIRNNHSKYKFRNISCINETRNHSATHC